MQHDTYVDSNGLFVGSIALETNDMYSQLFLNCDVSYVSYSSNANIETQCSNNTNGSSYLHMRYIAGHSHVILYVTGFMSTQRDELR